MKLVKVRFGAARSRARALGTLLSAALCLASAPDAAAQCTVAGAPIDIHVPIGQQGRPALLSPGFNSNLALYRNGSSGPWRMLMQESFGYAVFDLTNPAAPVVIKWDDLRLDTNRVPQAGDGQSYIQTIAASGDGQRVAFSTTGPSYPWNSVLGSADGSNGWTMWGDTAPTRGSATVIQTLGSRYIHYGMDVTTTVYAADVTTLPGTFNPLNVPYQNTGWPAGYSAALAGNYLVYMSASNPAVIQVIDVSQPGPAGNITGGMPRTTIDSSFFGGRTLNTVKAAVDPANSSKVWLLVELYPASGENSPSYALLSVTEPTYGSFSAPVSAGPLFRVPSVAGEGWTVSGASSTLASINGTVHVLMWATRRLPSFKYVMYSTSTGAWPTLSTLPPTPQVIGDSGQNINPNFTVATDMSVLPGSANTAYAYLAAGLYAWALPMTCQAPDAKATAVLTAVNAATGGPVNSGDSMTIGDTLTFTASVVPAPQAGTFTDLSGWRWNIDLDFHAGNAVEDGGADPVVKNPDNAVFGSPALPPSTFTVVGPCDPTSGGTPSTGSGCWNSVRTNSASGGPDFNGSEAAGTGKPTTIAFEARNTNGTSGPKLFTINWKLPVVRLASTQILAGDALTTFGATDGHPQGTFKWYFDGAFQGCSTDSCAPVGAAATAGSHTYFVSVPYAQVGYQTPDYAGTAMGTYTITNFAPSFTVNGSTASAIATGVGAPITIANSSRRGGSVGVGGGFWYSLCQIPGGQTTCADNYVNFSTMGDAGASGSPPTSATIPNPGVGTWLLKLRVNYTNPSGTAYWPDAAGATGVTITITNVVSVTANATPNPAASGSVVSFSCSATGGTGTGYTYDWTGGPGVTVSTQPTFNQTVTNASTQNRVELYTCTVRDSGGTSGSALVTLTVLSGPGGGGRPTVSVTANPNPATDGQQVIVSCSATGGAGGYSYQILDDLGHTLASSNTYAFTVNNKTMNAKYQRYDCSVTDSASVSSTASVTVTLLPPPGPSCPAVDFAVYRNGARLVPGQTPFGVSIPMQASVADVLGFSITTGVSSQFDWDWGDGTPHQTGPMSDPTITYATHAYTAPRTYTVALRPMYSDNSTFCGGTTYEIQVSGPSADFTAGYDDGSVFVTTNVTGGKTVRFTASEVGATSYDWDFGDGTPHGSGPVATHTFNPGTPTVKLTLVKTGVTVSSTLTLTVVAPPEPPKWVVPGMAYANGAIPGTLWQSDVTIMNPDPVRDARYSVAFLDGNHPVDDYSKLTWIGPITVPALGSIGSTNVLLNTFGQALAAKPYGAILVRGDQAPLPPVITARTFNNGSPETGTFGLSVPSASATTGGVTGQASPAAATLIGLRQNAAATTNIGLVNLKNDWAVVALDFTDASGAALGTLQVDLNPYQARQVSQALTAVLGPGEARDLYSVRVRILQGTAVYPYASVIDTGSTDAIVVTSSDAPSNAYRVPGIIRARGANGEAWRSRITVGNPSATSRRVTLRFSYVPCGGSTDCTRRFTVEDNVTFGPGQTLSADDFVQFWLGSVFSESLSYQNSYLDVTPAAGDPNQEPLVVLGETYNATAAGHVGLQIPGYTPVDGASRTGANKRLVLTGLAATPTHRTNLALFAVAGATGKWVNLHVYSPQGTKLKDIPVQVDALSQVPSAALFSGLSGDLSRLSLVVDGLDDGVTVCGYATIIDNVSGDATFVKAQPVP